MLFVILTKGKHFDKLRKIENIVNQFIILYVVNSNHGMNYVAAFVIVKTGKVKVESYHCINFHM